MKNFLGLNGYEITGKLEERKNLILNIENGAMSKKDLANWLENNTKKL